MTSLKEGVTSLKVGEAQSKSRARKREKEEKRRKKKKRKEEKGGEKKGKKFISLFLTASFPPCHIVKADLHPTRTATIRTTRTIIDSG